MTGKVLIIGAGDVGQRIARGLAQSGGAGTSFVFRGSVPGPRAGPRRAPVDLLRNPSAIQRARCDAPGGRRSAAAQRAPGRARAVRRLALAVDVHGAPRRGGRHLDPRRSRRAPARTAANSPECGAGREDGRARVPHRQTSRYPTRTPSDPRASRTRADHRASATSSIQLRKVRARLRERLSATEPLPLARMVAHHQHVTGVMSCKPPSDPEMRARVYLGEEGARDDELAYTGTPLSRAHLPPGLSYNEITAAATLPVILALLPNARALRYSAPAPFGFAGRISREDRGG